MNTKQVEKLRKYPVIDKNFLKKHFGYEDNYSYLVLQRLEKKGVLTKIIKGKYTIIDDVFKIASNLYYPSYISFLTASMLKKCTNQIINTIQVVSNYNKVFKFKNYQIQLIKFDKNNLFGYENKNGTFICEDEKLLIDMLIYRNHSGNFNEIIKVVRNLDFDKKKIIKYLKKVSSNSLIKRVGFLLDEYKNLDIRNKVELDNNYVYLDVLTKGMDKTVSKWRIKYD